MNFNTQGFFKPLIGLALAATLAGSAYAAENGQHHRGNHNPLQRLQSRLNLSADQVARLQPTFDSFRQRHQAERSQSMARFQSILTPDQIAKLQAAHQDGNQGHGRHAFKDLNLTDAQKAQMKSYWEQNRSARQAERQQMDAQVMAVLTPDQQAKYQEMKKNWGEHKGGRHHHRHSDSQNQ